MLSENNGFIFPAGKGSAIGYKDEVFDSEFCKMFISYLHLEENKNFFEKGITADPSLEGWKISVDVGISGSNNRANLNQKDMLEMFNIYIFHRLTKVLNDFTELYEHCNFWQSRFDTGYRYQYYKKNTGQYKPHVDGSPFDEPGYAERVIACIVYLNTVDEGGETSFPLHDVKVKAVEGRVCLFPCQFNYLHAGEIPTSGDKHIISTFFICPMTDEKIEKYIQRREPWIPQLEPDTNLLSGL